MQGESDAQLVNSVYLDNRAMELYHGRLDKTPGAIAIRMRWYGTSTPSTVFVERKTHRESWCGDVSVKERFIVNEKQVPDILNGRFNIDEEISKMKAKGKSDENIKEWLTLVQEVTQAVDYKQLEPTMRTQYMRTAFQIPFDATVRVSLDTNLCMINERTDEVVRGARWYRDPTVPVPKNEIIRFPHAVLEIKLQLENEYSTPPWVTELVNSNMLHQVHKFSKFIHGCASLMPDEVQAFPYWIDDSTLQVSMANAPAKEYLNNKNEGANVIYSHLLPHDESGQTRIKKVHNNHNNLIMETEMTPMLSSKPNNGYHALGSSTHINDEESRLVSNEIYDEEEYERCSASWWSKCCPSLAEAFEEMEDMKMTTQKVIKFYYDTVSYIVVIIVL
jgi:SPX domain protein involved in polyphosphate accumulation